MKITIKVTVFIDKGLLLVLFEKILESTLTIV